MVLVLAYGSYAGLWFLCCIMIFILCHGCVVLALVPALIFDLMQLYISSAV
jgi:hypothetical protein